MRTIAAKNTKVQIIEKEKPEIKPSHLLIKTLHSAISPGTEIGLIQKSQNRKIFLGYSAVGVVEEVGQSVEGFKKGDIVACYGAPYVEHSEYILVPVTLCAKVPSNVSSKEASLVGIGAIAIHALRIAKLEFGETVCVIGLGLLGQMIAKIADAAAYNVITSDLQIERTTMLYEESGIKSYSNIADMETALNETTERNGADAILLCAGGKKSPLTSQSLNWIRDKGKVVIVGDIEPDFPRTPMFGKEAEILISRAGGPGRYDPVFEEQAIDYPYGYVRWTEGRNVEEYLRLVNEGRINVKPFLTDEIKFAEAPKAYEELLNKGTTTLTKIINFS